MIQMHPITYAKLYRACSSVTDALPKLPPAGSVNSFMGYRVVTDPRIPPCQDSWVPPAPDRYWAYGPEDEEWMRFFGMGSVAFLPHVYFVGEESNGDILKFTKQRLQEG